MVPFIVSNACRQYLDAFEYVSPGQVSKFPIFISLSHVDFNGKPDAACMYRTSSSTLGRSYALYTKIVVLLLYAFWCNSSSLFGLR